MDVSCGFTFSVKRVSDPHTRNILWSLAGTIAATVIIFASLGSIQNQCRFEDPSLLSGISGFSGAVLGCKKLYRYYWFITVLSFLTAVYGAWTAAHGFLAGRRGAVLGLLVVANLLTINMTDAFLSIVDVPKWQSGPARDRVRTMIAGCIITAFFQAVSIILVGYDPSAVAPVAKSAPKEASKDETPAVELATAVPTAAQPAEAAAEPAVTADVEAPAAPAAEEPQSAVAVEVQ